jgi:hypothetical protein
MSSHPFETFCEMIESLPPRAVLRAVAIERFMLEEDLAMGRTSPNDETGLILTFCRFLEDAAHGELAVPRIMPPRHWTFYGKIVEQLAAAGELPRKVREDFETAFHNAFSRIRG